MYYFLKLIILLELKPSDKTILRLFKKRAVILMIYVMQRTVIESTLGNMRQKVLYTQIPAWKY